MCHRRARGSCSLSVEARVRGTEPDRAATEESTALRLGGGGGGGEGWRVLGKRALSSSAGRVRELRRGLAQLAPIAATSRLDIEVSRKEEKKIKQRTVPPLSTRANQPTTSPTLSNSVRLQHGSLGRPNSHQTNSARLSARVVAATPHASAPSVRPSSVRPSPSCHCRACYPSSCQPRASWRAGYLIIASDPNCALASLDKDHRHARRRQE